MPEIARIRRGMGRRLKTPVRRHLETTADIRHGVQASNVGGSIFL
jgi:hypothetical protein